MDINSMQIVGEIVLASMNLFDHNVQEGSMEEERNSVEEKREYNTCDWCLQVIGKRVSQEFPLLSNRELE